MERDRQNVLSFGTIFCSFNPLATHKIKVLKKYKKMPIDIIILQMCTINENIGCMALEIRSATDRSFSHFGPFFALLTP